MHGLERLRNGSRGKKIDRINMRSGRRELGNFLRGGHGRRSRVEHGGCAEVTNANEVAGPPKGCKRHYQQPVAGYDPSAMSARAIASAASHRRIEQASAWLEI